MLRRKLLSGLLAAPLVVRDYSVLMPVMNLLLTAPTVWHVSGRAAGSGRSWSDPTNLEFALLHAAHGDHIMLGAGAYLPARVYRPTPARAD